MINEAPVSLNKKKTRKISGQLLCSREYKNVQMMGERIQRELFIFEA